MLRKVFLLCSGCLLSCALMALPIDESAAHKIALDFLNSQKVAYARQSKNVQRSVPSLHMVYPVAQATRSSMALDPAYYVFAADEQDGFVVVAGDDEVKPIVGYSLTSSFDIANIPPALQEYLSAYEQYVGAVRSGAVQPSLVAETSASTTPVFPFISTTWSQGAPYNNLCPTVDGTHCVTGCVATAMAQIMNYYEWPKSAAGDNFIISVGGTKYSDGFASEYDWDNMLDVYDGTTNYNSTQADAVACLMRDAGYAVKMQYGKNGSGAFDSDACAALFDYFGYSSQVKYVLRDYYTDEHWHEMIYEQLNAGCPILYSGQGTSGHAFICCGVDDSRRYYINWGWGGWCDGYFDFNNMTPDSDNYNNNQGAIINIMPKNESDNEGDYCIAPHIGKFIITEQNQSVESPYVVHDIWIENTSGRTMTSYFAYALYKDDEMVSNMTVFAGINFAPNTYQGYSIKVPVNNLPVSTAQYEIRYLWSTDQSVWHEPQGDGAKVYMNRTPVGHLFSLDKGTVHKDGNKVTLEGVVDAASIETTLKDETVTSVDMQYAIFDNAKITAANPNALFYAYEGALCNTSNVVIGGSCENLLIQDGYPFAADEITATTAQYVRKLDDSKYGTVVLPFAPDATTKSKYTFYTLDSQEGNVLNFRIVDEPQANTPYLYKNKVDGAEDFTASDVAVSSAIEESAIDGWTMKGTYQKLQYTDAETLAKLYYISNNKVMNATSSLRIKPFRAYFEGTEGVGAASQSIGIRLEGTTEVLPIEVFGEQDVLYDLFGRRIESVPQGYYIKNGKKYYGK